MISKLAGLAAIFAVGVMSAMPAHAQKQYKDLTQAELDELYCVYDGAGKEDDDYYAIGGTFLDNITNADGLNKVADMIGPFTKACTEKYGWDQDRAQLGTMMGVVGIASDVLGEDLLDEGLTDAQIDGILAAAELLTDDDIDALYDGTYQQNQTVKDHAIARLKEKNVPVTDDDVGDLLLYMELNVVGLYTSQDWLDHVFK